MMIALAIVVLFGPDKLPEIARGLGQGVRKMRGAMEDVKSEIMKETDNPVSEIKREIEKVKQAAKDYDPMADVKKDLDFNNIYDSNSSANTNITTPTQPETDPLSTDHNGPVSR